MARLTFPSDRLVYTASTYAGSAFTSAANAVATVYSDSAGTTLADVQNIDGSANATATFTVDTTSRLPLFLGPAAGTDTLYVKVGTGPVTAIYAVTSGDISAAVGIEVTNRTAADAAHVAAANPHSVTPQMIGAPTVVIHGATAGTARPAGATFVHWVGSVAPTNVTGNDEWTDTANKILKRWNGSSFDSLGSAASSGLTPTATKTANYTAVKGDLVPVDTTSGAITVTLPASPTAGDMVGVYKKTTDANAVTVAGTIDAQTNASISYPGSGALPGATFEFIGGTVGWKLIATYSTVGPQGATGATGPAGATGSNGPQALQSAGVIGAWYPSCPLPASASNTSMGTGWLMMDVPVIAQENITISKVGCFIGSAGAAGATVRMGIYTVTNSGAPYDVTLNSGYGTLLVDAGTVVATGTGATTITLGSPVTISAGTAFAVAVVVQGTGGNVGINKTFVQNTINCGPWGANGSILNGCLIGLLQGSITGALPSTYTPSQFDTVNKAAGGWYFRSA